MKDNKKEKNKKKNMDVKPKNDKVFIILIIILIIISIVLVIVRLVTSNSLKTDDDLVKELHGYFNIEQLANCDGLFNYSTEKIDYDKVSSEAKLCLAYQKANIESATAETHKAKKKDSTCNVDGMIFKTDDDTDECTVTKIDKNIIDSSYKKIFGKDIENNESFLSDTFHICYLKDDSYYCGLSETVSYTIGSEKVIYRVMEKAKEKGDQIIIYDFFARINDNKCYTSYTTDNTNSECTNNLKDDTKVDYKFLKKYGTKYKHTYQKADDGTYYWVNSEPVK